MSASLCAQLCIFAVWSDGRAARLSSAKAATAVRIRFGPPKKKESPVNFELAGLFFFKRQQVLSSDLLEILGK